MITNIIHFKNKLLRLEISYHISIHPHTIADHLCRKKCEKKIEFVSLIHSQMSGIHIYSRLSLGVGHSFTISRVN